VRFEGWFNAAGELDGRGTMHFPDGSWQSCQWTDGVPHGPGEYVGDDLSIIKGTWVEGDLQGHVQEVTCGGLVIYDGLYQDSRRHGLGILRFQDGSRVEGEFAHGTLEGHAKFFYPDGVSGFEGRWVDGDMQEARYFGPLPDEPPLPWTGEHGKTGWREVVFTADETTETEMGNHLLLRDPYESRVLCHLHLLPMRPDLHRVCCACIYGSDFSCTGYACSGVGWAVRRSAARHGKGSPATIRPARACLLSAKSRQASSWPITMACVCRIAK